MTYDPLLDPEAYFDTGLKLKDIKKKEPPLKPQEPEPNTTPPLAAGSAHFNLEDLADRWRIHGVKYRNNIYTVDLGKTLLDNGAMKTQDEWIAYSQQAQQQRKPHVGSAPLQHSLHSTLYNNKDNPRHKTLIEHIRKALQQDFKKHWMATLTQVTHQPEIGVLTKVKALFGKKPHTLENKDSIIHDTSLPSQHTIKENITGPDQYITHGNNAAALNALIGDNDPHHINEVYTWITGNNTYLWRLTSKPTKTDQRPVSLGFGSFGLCANVYFVGRRPARGVGTQKIFQSK